MVRGATEQVLGRSSLVVCRKTRLTVEIKKAEPKKPSNPQPAPGYRSNPRACSFGDEYGHRVTLTRALMVDMALAPLEIQEALLVGLVHIIVAMQLVLSSVLILVIPTVVQVVTMEIPAWVMLVDLG
ncbi:hypothetical protein Droror1_Dr00014294 [Drosera rotundifolia]